MRRNVSIGLMLLAICALSNLVRADDTPTTLKGTMTCAKCALKEAGACQNVLQVKEGDNTVNYYVADNEVSKDSHKKVCKAPAENVSITGTVEEKDGKKWINPTKIEGLPQ